MRPRLQEAAGAHSSRNNLSRSPEYKDRWLRLFVDSGRKKKKGRQKSGKKGKCRRIHVDKFSAPLGALRLGLVIYPCGTSSHSSAMKRQISIEFSSSPASSPRYPQPTPLFQSRSVTKKRKPRSQDASLFSPLFPLFFPYFFPPFPSFLFFNGKKAYLQTARKRLLH